MTGSRRICRTGPEAGAKDVVSLGGGQLISAIGRFGPHAGRFVHHCHVYEHEDHRMMRPISLLPGWRWATWAGSRAGASATACPWMAARRC